jgi:phosphatidylserine/phosphatidylglycerophosphate/cardiolipin synthase-like enzyme
VSTLQEPGTVDKFKIGGWTPGYPANIRNYYSPVDDVHGALLATIKSARHSLIIGLFGWDDQEIQDAVMEKANNEHCYVQLTLDSSQAGGKHEAQMLKLFNSPSTSVAIGRSEKGAIMHLKQVVIDNAVVITGSTNFSIGGETKQDNVMTIIEDAYVAGEAAARLSAIHSNMQAKAAQVASTK